MIDQNIDTQGCFKVMEHVVDLHNHKSHTGTRDYTPPITEEMGEIGDISIHTDFYFNQ